MHQVSGVIFTGEEFIEGTIHFKDGIIHEVSNGITKDSKDTKTEVPMARGIILPPMVNAHTHIGDSVVKLNGRGTLDELVAPPNGLKHRVLRETPEEDIISAMTRTVQDFQAQGIGWFYDFREQGLAGIRQIEKATAGATTRPIILGRPSDTGYDQEEMDALMMRSAGVGLSSISDWPQTPTRKNVLKHSRKRKVSEDSRKGEVQDNSRIENAQANAINEVASHARTSGKMVALHASEQHREDILQIMNLEPDLIVHMVHATPEDMRICADRSVPVAICPRTNTFFGTIPDIAEMRKAGITLLLGTDNVMINGTSLWEEMRFLNGLAPSTGLSPVDIVKMVFSNPYKALSPGYGMPRFKGRFGSFYHGARADFIVVSRKTTDPALTLVSGISRADLTFNSLGYDGEETNNRRNSK